MTTTETPYVIIEPVPLARDLSKVRAEIEREKAEIERLRARLSENPDYQLLEDAEFVLAKLRTQEGEAKTRLAAELIKSFNVTGERKFPGIGDIAIRRKVTYEDEPAIRWAINAGMHALLSVNRSAADKAFEGLADNLDFVEGVEEPFARIASKLEVA